MTTPSIDRSKHIAPAHSSKMAKAPKIKFAKGNAQLAVHGTVENVIFGKRESASPIDPTKYIAALGLGAASDINCAGEMIIIDGVAHIRPSGKDFSSKTATSNRPVLSPFTVGIAKNTLPNGRFVLNAQEGIPFASLPEEIRQNFMSPSSGIAFVGTVTFKEMDAVAVKKAPIDGSNIMDHKEEYWAKPQVVANQTAIVFGLAADNEYPDPTIFYQNPADKTPPQQLHTHVLTASGQVWHLLPQSIVTSAKLSIYMYSRTELLPNIPADRK